MAMPPFGDACSDAEIGAAANYVTARFVASGSRLTAESIASLRLHTLTDHLLHNLLWLRSDLGSDVPTCD